MFIYCNDIGTKEKLLLKGYKFICENDIGNKKCYIFGTVDFELLMKILVPFSS